MYPCVNDVIIVDLSAIWMPRAYVLLFPDFGVSAHDGGIVRLLGCFPLTLSIHDSEGKVHVGRAGAFRGEIQQHHFRDTLLNYMPKLCKNMRQTGRMKSAEVSVFRWSDERFHTSRVRIRFCRFCAGKHGRGIPGSFATTRSTGR